MKNVIPIIQLTQPPRCLITDRDFLNIGYKLASVEKDHSRVKRSVTAPHHTTPHTNTSTARSIYIEAQRFFGARACTQPHGGFALSQCYCHHTASMVCPTNTASSPQLKARPPHLDRRVPISVESIPTSVELTPTHEH